MKYVIIALKGILFGIANLIPGVSGGTMAVLTGVYEEFLDSVNHIFSSFKKSFLFLFPYAIGIIIAVLLGSKLISLCLDNIPIPTISLFIGMIIGGLPSLSKPVVKQFKIVNFAIMIVAVLLVLSFLFIPTRTDTTVLSGVDYLLLFVSGIFASAAMVLPGVSGMLIFMLFGYYNVVMDTLSNISDFTIFLDNIKVILPLGIGVLVGLFSSCKAFSILLKKFPVQGRFAIIGFVIASCICVFKKMFMAGYNFDALNIFLMIVMIIVGIALSFILGIVGKKKNIELDEIVDAE